MRLLLAGIAAFGLSTQASVAGTELIAGAAVRIQSSSIESGWHGGRLQRDAQQCWMVKLDRPTKDHYTLLSLLVVDQLEITAAHSTDGDTWSPVGIKAVLLASPAVCREYGAD